MNDTLIKSKAREAYNKYGIILFYIKYEPCTSIYTFSFSRYSDGKWAWSQIRRQITDSDIVRIFDAAYKHYDVNNERKKDDLENRDI